MGTDGVPTGLGTFGELADQVAGLGSGSGLEIAFNLALASAFAYAGYAAGRALAGRSPALAGVVAAVAGALFLDGAQASYFLVNAGISYLGFLYPVLREAYFRFSD